MTMKKSFALAALAVGFSLPALSQTPPAPTPDDVPLAVMSEWAQAAIAACKANTYNVTAAYMTPDFTMKLVMRGDGAAGRTVDIARRKAYTVLKTGKTSGEFGASVPAAAGAPAAGALPGQVPGENVDTNLVTFPGGLPVKIGGKIVGAVSISGAPGGDKDEACASAGLAKIAGKLTAKP
jgi:uncharacterized protein GlcG (DUF336 family)